MYQKTTGIHEQKFYAEQAQPVREGLKIKEPVPLYTAPRQWQGLTDEELDAMRQESGLHFVTLREFRIVAKAIEEKLKELNG